MDSFSPTDRTVIRTLLERAHVCDADIVFDLGCGDGRVLIEARRQGAAQAVGYEILGELAAKVSAHLSSDPGVLVRHDDGMSIPWSGFDVVVSTHEDQWEEILTKFLNESKPGARIVRMSGEPIVRCKP